ncbi:glycosyltransferase family 4 protein [Vampirovibrio chlorellavorus]|uniref:glycosyltransferase family 4 protein n=1 Tax=Vampirovibrio chlorellavorus TaxID=758823 RepID=UPI0026F10939|nr:glycosyltransferase family 4 protein [Vampirovibrio chlorellavorus]
MLSVGDDASSVLSASARQKIRVGMVLDQPFPPDARVEREAMALVAAGFEVHLLCAVHPDDLNTPGRLRDEAYQGFYIHRVNPKEVSIEIPLVKKPSRFLYKGALKNYFHHFKNIDTAWHTLIHRFCKNYNIQILHIHDLRLVDTGLSVSARYGLPLVADLHENYPALMQMMKGRHNAEHGLKQRERWEEIELNSIQRATHVITVTQEAKERLLAKGLPESKVLVVENTVDTEKFLAAPVNQEVIRHFKPNFVLTYVGHLNDTHRGIQTVIEAMGLLRDEIPELRFIGAGAMRDPYYQKLEPLIQQFGLQDRVHFTGWLDETDFVTYIEASDICLCPHLVNDHTNATFPNKVYLYHLFKKPIITSNAVPLQRYIESTGGGLVFQSGDAPMLAELIRMLYSRPDLRREMALRGFQAVMSQYNWQQTARQFTELYQQLSSSLRQSPTAHG